MLNLTLLLTLFHIQVMENDLNATTCITYKFRDGSLLATDFVLWIVRTLTGKEACYKAEALLETKAPLKAFVLLSKILDNVTFSNKRADLGVDKIIRARWYYTMLSTSNYNREASTLYHCVLRNNNYPIREMCFIALEGLYTSIANNVLTSKYLDPCILSNIKLLNSSIPRGVALWVISKYLGKRPQVGHRGVELVTQLLKSGYAYFLYYNRNLTKLFENLYKTLSGSCRPVEVLALLISYFSKGEMWWMYYPLYLKALSDELMTRKGSS